MPDSEHYRKLERMYHAAPINAFFAPRLEVGEGTATITFEVLPKFHHAAGAAHGSVYFKALDDAAFFAANSMSEDVFFLTTSFTIHLLRPISAGRARARGRIIHASQRLYVAEARMVDAADRLVAQGTGSFVRSSMPLTPEIGYV